MQKKNMGKEERERGRNVRMRKGKENKRRKKK